jgi:hypothetical protein
VKVGETVTESQTLHLSVGPKAAVRYRVLWKRRVRSGQRVYQVNGGEITVPYRLTYGLACEVQSQELKRRSASRNAGFWQLRECSRRPLEVVFFHMNTSRESSARRLRLEPRLLEPATPRGGLDRSRFRSAR